MQPRPQQIDVAAPGAAKIELRGIQKVFLDPRVGPVTACDDIDLVVRAGEFVSIVGPSGCGKSTVFNMIAGLIKPSAGDILVDGAAVAGETGHVGYMLQKDLLLPWRTILDNVVLGAELLGADRAKVKEEARTLMADFGLKGFEDVWPSRLSGGMRQRAALMRTVLSGKDTLLLDEPFGALDAMTKLLMQEWLLSIWDEFGRTILFITHDLDEAIFLSDRIYVMSARPGRIKAAIEVELPRPRTYEITGSDAFAAIKQPLLALVHAELEKSLRGSEQ